MFTEVMPHLCDSCQASGLGQAWEKKENHKTVHNDKLPRSGFVQLLSILISIVLAYCQHSTATDLSIPTAILLRFPHLSKEILRA